MARDEAPVKDWRHLHWNEPFDDDEEFRNTIADTEATVATEAAMRAGM